MITLFQLPTFENNLPDYVEKLRCLVFLTQQEAADYFHLHRTRVTRYEAFQAKDKPNIGYIAGLCLLIVEQSEQPTEAQTRLFQEINKVLTSRYYRKKPFQTWDDVQNAAQTFHSKQREKTSLKNEDMIHSVSIAEASWISQINQQFGPPSYTEFIGYEDELGYLLNALVERETFFLIAIEGQGGLGKTALTEKLIRTVDVSQRFQRIAWVSTRKQAFTPGIGLQTIGDATLDFNAMFDSLLAQFDSTIPPTLPASQKKAILRETLGNTPCLIVIDNLETVADYQVLVPELSALVNPSKIVFTSRYRVKGFAGIYCVALPGLTESDVVLFIRHQAQVQGLHRLVTASDDQLKSITKLVGGNPLALKLVVGQISFLSLSQVIENLKHIPDKETEDFYAFIYQHSWQLLDQTSQLVFLAMPLVQNGTLQQLTAVTQLDLPSVIAALRALTRLSLVDVAGDLTEARYKIHALTETFLVRDMWQQQIVDLNNSADLFREYISRNVQFWRNWLKINQSDSVAMDNASERILRAIRFGSMADQTWPDVYELILAFSPYMEKKGYWATWSQTLNEAIKTAQRLDDFQNAANLAVTLALMWQRQNRFREAVARYRQAIQMARQADNQFALARAFTNLGFLFTEQGYWFRAEVFCCQALIIFKQINSPYGQAHTENHLGLLYSRQGLWDQAAAHLETACTLWQTDKNASGLLHGYINFGVLYLKQEKPDQVLEFLNKARQQAAAIDHSAELGLIYANMAIAQRLRGDLIQAKALNETAETICQQQSDLEGLARVWDNLGVVYTLQQHWETATAYLEKSLAMWRRIDNQLGEVETLFDLMTYEIARGEPKKALAWLREAENLMKNTVSIDRSNIYRTRLEKYRRNLTGDQSRQLPADE